MSNKWFPLILQHIRKKQKLEKALQCTTSKALIQDQLGKIMVKGNKLTTSSRKILLPNGFAHIYFIEITKHLNMQELNDSSTPLVFILHTLVFRENSRNSLALITHVNKTK